MIEDTEATRQRRALLRARLGRVTLVCLGTFVAVWGGLAVWLYRLHYETDYPNGTTQNSATFVDYHASLVVRRDVVYKSRDSYTTVFRWNSKGFNLGNAARGTGTCDQMAQSIVVLARIVQDLTVMVCDEGTERTVYVSRSIMVRYPDWLRWLT